jgi:hypothetical protein
LARNYDYGNLVNCGEGSWHVVYWAQGILACCVLQADFTSVKRIFSFASVHGQRMPSGSTRWQNEKFGLTYNLIEIE